LHGYDAGHTNREEVYKMSRMYETIYIVKPDLNDEENKALTTRINEVIEKMNGDVRKLEDWGVRKLAYPINKVARGRYMYLRSDGDAALIAELERRLRLDDRVIRYQTVKLDKDTITVAPAVPVEAEETAPAEEAGSENE
jgi:small subunit ribosomal protein S6